MKNTEDISDPMELENASTSLPDKETEFSKGTFQFCDARKEIGLE